MNPQRPARLNRVVLALLGLLCLAAGLFALLIGTGGLGTPLAIRQDARLLTGTPTVTWYAPWIGAIVAVLLTFVVVRWLVAQTVRQPRGGEWQLVEDTRSGATFIDSDAAATPLADEIADYPGVLSANARLTGLRQDPHLYLRVSTGTRANIVDLRHRIKTDGIPNLVRALDLSTVSTEIVIQLSTPSRSHTRVG